MGGGVHLTFQSESRLAWTCVPLRAQTATPQHLAQSRREHERGQEQEHKHEHEHQHQHKRS